MIIEFEEGELREKILADKYNFLVFSAAGEHPLYLVGGYLRDMLRGKVNSDRDYVAGGDYESLLGHVVDATNGRLVRLGGYLCRVVLKDKSTLDFSPLVRDISYDLSHRDFTVNSLAWAPDSGLVDPHGGLGDLRQERISMIRRDNIERDPIRILRAYRFAGELSYRMDPRTREAIRELSHKIIGQKSERITLEFFKILNLAASEEILSMMGRDGCLYHLFPITHEELRRKLRAFSRVERIFNALPLMYKEILCERGQEYLSCLGMLRLEVLLGGISTNALTISSVIVKKLRMIEKAKELLSKGKWSRDEIFEAFSLLGDTSIDFLIMTDRAVFLSEYKRFCKLNKDSLLTTDEIMAANVLLRGAKLGKAIRMLKKAQFDHQIRSRRDAVDLLNCFSNNLT